MKDTFKFIFACLGIAVLSACGGGGTAVQVPPPKYAGMFLAGDSLTSNAFWDVDVRKAFNPPVWVMAAVPGTTSTQILASYDRAIHPNVVPNSVFLGTAGTNDLFTASIDSDTTMTNLHEIWRKARADGLKVVAFTISIAPSACDCVARQATINARIRADRGLYDVLIDVEKLLPDTSDKTKYFDTVHWAEGGAAVITNAIVTALR